MNIAVEEKWEQSKKSLLASFTENVEVTCMIPGWEPVDIEQGLKWLQSSIYEGFVVRFETKKEKNGYKVIFEISEPECE